MTKRNPDKNDPVPWHAIRVLCRKCGKVKEPLWKNAKNRWPRCCGRQMSQTAYATLGPK